MLFQPLERVRFFLVQTDEYAARFRALGIPASQVLVAGSLKYDALPAAADAERLEAEYRGRLGLGEAPVLVCGSTHPTEERDLLGAYRALRAEFPALRLVLAPRHTERTDEVLAECASAGVPAVRKTELEAVFSSRGPAAPVPSFCEAASRQPQRPFAESAIVVDTMGELARLYAVATVVFVGGSLVPHGGQNILEPAGLGKPVLFGPHVENFREGAALLLQGGAGEQVSDASQLAPAIARLLREPGRASELGRRGRAIIEARRGAAKTTVAVIKDVLSNGCRSRAQPFPGREGAVPSRLVRGRSHRLRDAVTQGTGK